MSLLDYLPWTFQPRTNANPQQDFWHPEQTGLPSLDEAATKLKQFGIDPALVDPFAPPPPPPKPMEPSAMPTLEQAHSALMQFGIDPDNVAQGRVPDWLAQQQFAPGFQEPFQPTTQTQGQMLGELRRSDQDLAAWRASQMPGFTFNPLVRAGEQAGAGIAQTAGVATNVVARGLEKAGLIEPIGDVSGVFLDYLAAREEGYKQKYGHPTPFAERMVTGVVKSLAEIASIGGALGSGGYLAVMAAQSYDAGLHEASQAGIESKGQQHAYAAVNATADTLTEMLFMGQGKGAAAALLGFKQPLKQAFREVLNTFGEEATEEFTAQLLQNANKLAHNIPILDENGQPKTGLAALFDGTIEPTLTGGLTGGIAGGAAHYAQYGMPSFGRQQQPLGPQLAPPPGAGPTVPQPPVPGFVTPPPGAPQPPAPQPPAPQPQPPNVPTPSPPPTPPVPAPPPVVEKPPTPAPAPQPPVEQPPGPQPRAPAPIPETTEGPGGAPIPAPEVGTFAHAALQDVAEVELHDGTRHKVSALWKPTAYDASAGEIKLESGQYVDEPMVSKLFGRDGSVIWSATPAAPEAPKPPAGVPMMITQKMRQQLADLGYSEEAIRGMTPQQAWDVINAATPAGGGVTTPPQGGAAPPAEPEAPAPGKPRAPIENPEQVADKAAQQWLEEEIEDYRKRKGGEPPDLARHGREHYLNILRDDARQIIRGISDPREMRKVMVQGLLESGLPAYRRFFEELTGEKLPKGKHALEFFLKKFNGLDAILEEEEQRREKDYAEEKARHREESIAHEKHLDEVMTRFHKSITGEELVDLIERLGSGGMKIHEAVRGVLTRSVKHISPTGIKTEGSLQPHLYQKNVGAPLTLADIRKIHTQMGKVIEKWKAEAPQREAEEKQRKEEYEKHRREYDEDTRKKLEDLRSRFKTEITGKELVWLARHLGVRVDSRLARIVEKLESVTPLGQYSGELYETGPQIKDLHYRVADALDALGAKSEAKPEPTAPPPPKVEQPEPTPPKPPAERPPTAPKGKAPTAEGGQRHFPEMAEEAVGPIERANRRRPLMIALEEIRQKYGDEIANKFIPVLEDVATQIRNDSEIKQALGDEDLHLAHELARDLAHDQADWKLLDLDPETVDFDITDEMLDKVAESIVKRMQQEIAKGPKPPVESEQEPAPPEPAPPEGEPSGRRPRGGGGGGGGGRAKRPGAVQPDTGVGGGPGEPGANAPPAPGEPAAPPPDTGVAPRPEGEGLPGERGPTEEKTPEGDVRPDIGTRPKRPSPDQPGLAGPGAAEPGGGEAPPEVQGEARTGVNHVIAPEDVIVPKGFPAKAQANVDAIRLLKTLEAENRDATPEEKKVLARYTGWGAMSQAFDRYTGEAMIRESAYGRDENWEKKWGEVYRILKDELTEDEWYKARDTTINAHYTSRPIIEKMWQAVRHFGFTGGRVLEPGAGIGHFIGLAPPEVGSKSKFYAVEMDPLSSRMMEKLYPRAKIINKDLNEAKIAPNSVDLVIGNVPFAAQTQPDSEERYGQDLNLHNYFIARALDAVRPGGIVAVISTHNTLDARVDQRTFLVGKGDLVGAIRLPNNAFRENAGTDVAADILFLRKPIGNQHIENLWRLTEDVPADGGTTTATVNQYFVDHPEMVLGEHSMQGKMYARKADEKEYTVKPDGRNLIEAIDKATATLPAEIMAATGKAEGEVIKAEEEDEAIHGSIVEKNGKVYFSAKGQLHELVPGGKLPEGAHPSLNKAEVIKRAKDYAALRDKWRAHRALMLSPDSTDAEFKKSLKEINVIFDKYIKAHGHLDDVKTRPFTSDPDYWFVQSLELMTGQEIDPKTNKERKTYKKSEALTKRILDGSRRPPTSASTAPDAIRISLGYRGRIDPAYVAQLLGKSVLEVVTSTLPKSGMAYENPESGEWEISERYLSGNVREKLRLAEDAAESDPKYKANVEALKKVQPAPIAIKGIQNFRLGAAWLPAHVVQNFAREIFRDYQASVQYIDAIDGWRVGSISNEAWNVGNKDASDLLEAALNLKDPVVRINIGPRGSPQYVVDEKATTGARAKIQQLQKEWKRYAEKNEEARDAVEAAFNDRFNSYVPMTYDGSHLQLPNSNTEITLRDYQRDAVWRILLDGRALLAHAVGAGKTFLMVAAAMEQKRLGLAKRPLIAVQNSTLGQFAKSFLRLYPGARVLVATKNDLKKENRQAFLARSLATDWDAIVMPQSTFDRLPIDPKTEIAYVKEQLEILEAEIEKEERAESKSRRRKKSSTVKEIVKARNRLQKRLADAMKRSKESTDAVTFEQLGIDSLFVDEAHAYKKPFFQSKLDKLVGLNLTENPTSMALMMKIRHVREKSNGRNIVLATGTPITNTLGEAWHMLNYVAPDVLKDWGVDTFDRFVGAFAMTETIAEMNAGGTWVKKQALSRFTNGDEFARLIRTAWDVISPDMLRAKLIALGEGGLPALKGGKVQSITVPLSAGGKKFQEIVKKAYAIYKGMSGQDKKLNNWVPISLFGAGKAASIDIRLIVPGAKAEVGGKLDKMTELALQEYHDSKEVKGTQLIFSDSFNPRNMTKLWKFLEGETVDLNIPMEEAKEESEKGAFLFNDIKKRLIAGGVPANEIAAVADYNNDDAREALFERVNQGQIRFLLGSSAKMGVGVNVQKRLVALHHLDSPYMPTDLEQREGRILRFGNLNPEVSIYRYAMSGTLDSAILNKLVRKAKVVWQAITGKAGREFEDPASAVTLSMEEQLASVLDDPLYFEKLDLEYKKRELEMEKESHSDEVGRAEYRLRGVRETIRDYEKRYIPNAEETEKNINALLKSGNWSIDKEKMEDEKAIAAKIDSIIKEHEKNVLKLTKDEKVAPYEPDRGNQTKAYSENLRKGIKFGDMNIVIRSGAFQKFAGIEEKKVVLEWLTKTLVDFLPTWNPNASIYQGYAVTGSGIVDVLNSLDDRARQAVEEVKKNLEAKKREAVDYEEVVNSKWEKDDELEKVTKRLNEITEQMEAKSQAEAKQHEEAVQHRRHPPHAPQPDALDEEEDEDEDLRALRRQHYPTDRFATGTGTSAGPGNVPTFATAPKKKTFWQKAYEKLKLPKLSPKKKGPISAHDIRYSLSRLWGYPILKGRLRNKALAYYELLSKVIRVSSPEWANLGVIFHEVAHGIDDHTDLFTSMPQRVKDELGPLDYNQKRKDPTEGFAEFLRHVFTTNAGYTVAPQAYQHLSDWLDKHEEEKAKFQKMWNWIERFRKQNPQDTILANQWAMGRRAMELDKEKMEAMKDTLTSGVSAFRSAMQDEASVIKEIAGRAIEKKYGAMAPIRKQEFNERIDELMGSYEARAADAWENGIFTISGNKPQKLAESAKHYMRNIARNELKEWETFVDAQDALSRIARRPNYNPGEEERVYRARVAEVQADAAKFKRFEDAAKGMRQFSEGLLMLAVNEGVIGFTAAKRMIDSQKDYYVPRYRTREVGLFGRAKQFVMGTSKSLLGGRSPFRRMTEVGSSDAILPPLQAYMRQNQEVHNAAVKYAMMMPFLRLTLPALGGAPGMSEWIVKTDAKWVKDKAKLEQLLSDMTKPKRIGTSIRQPLIDEDFAQLIKDVSGLRDGTLSNIGWQRLEFRYGTNDPRTLTALTDHVPDLDDAVAWYRQDFSSDPREHVVRVMVDDKPLMVQFPHPYVYNAIMGMRTPMQANTFARLWTGIINAQAKFVTNPIKAMSVALHPSTILSLAVIDAAMFPIQSKHTGWFDRYYAHLISVGGVIGAKLRADRLPGFVGEKTVEWEILNELQEREGGKITGHRLGTPAQTTKAMIERTFARTTWEKFVVGVKYDTLNSVKDAIGILDSGMRLAEIAAVIRQAGYRPNGKATPAERQAGNNLWIDPQGRVIDALPQKLISRAIAAGNEVLTNFKRKGYMAREVDKVIPFFSAGMAGLEKELTTIGEIATGKGEAWGKRATAAAVLATVSLIYALMNGDDDDRKGMDGNIADRYWTFSTFGIPWLKIPKPRGFSFIPNLMEAFVAWTRGDKPRLGEKLWHEIEALTPPMRPAGFSTVYELIANTDWSGRPIEMKDDEHLAKYLRAGPHTLESSKFMSKYLTHWVGLSPSQTEYILNQYSGTMYTEYVGAIERAAQRKEQNILAKGAQTLAEAFTRKFETRGLYQRAIKDFYDQYGELETNVATAKHEGWSNDENEARLRQMTRYKEVLTKLRKQALKLSTNEEKLELGAYSVGLADYALGNPPRKSYPNPLSKETERDVTYIDDKTGERKSLRKEYIGTLGHALTASPERKLGEPIPKFVERFKEAAIDRKWAAQELKRLGFRTPEVENTLERRAARRGHHLSKESQFEIESAMAGATD